jgi:hypothetical protein
MSCSATFINVQKKYSLTRGLLKALADGVSDLFSATYVLNKSWTLSGWDNETYAADSRFFFRSIRGRRTHAIVGYRSIFILCPRSLLPARPSRQRARNNA